MRLRISSTLRAMRVFDVRNSSNSSKRLTRIWHISYIGMMLGIHNLNTMFQAQNDQTLKGPSKGEKVKQVIGEIGEIGSDNDK